MEKRELIRERRSKHIFATDDRDVVIIRYEDDASAFFNVKKASIAGKGLRNNMISSLIFSYLADNGVPNHFIERSSETEQLCRRVEVLPFELVIRNVSAGSMARRLAIPTGTVLPEPVIEMKLKNVMGHPMIYDTHAVAMKFVTRAEMDTVLDIAGRTNALLTALFLKVGIRLVDFQIDFGRDKDGNIILVDEITPDTCRLWDISTGESMDLDRFRNDMGGVQEAYRDVCDRLTGLKKEGII